MPPLIRAIEAVLVLMRAAGLALVLIAAVIALMLWLVRARHVSPFSAFSRFVRATLEPLITPFDRRLARHGIIGPTVPWWAVLVVLIIVAGLIGIVTFARSILVGAYFASNRGPRGIVWLALNWTIGLLQLALIVRVLTTWVGGAYSRVGRLAFRLTDWFMEPLRRALPQFGMVDISPLVAWLALVFIQGIVSKVV